MGERLAGGNVAIAHLMFVEPVFQLSQKLREGPAQAFSEGVATFGLILTILGALRFRADSNAFPGRSLHLLGLLVHRLNLLRQSSGDDRTRSHQHIRGHRPILGSGLHSRPDCRCRSRGTTGPVAAVQARSSSMTGVGRVNGAS
jgi:hypothetical protein